MKRLILAAAVAGILVVALSAMAFAAPPAPQAGQSFGRGAGIHAPGTGLANGTAVGPMYGRQGAGARGGRPAWAGQPDEVETLLGMTDAQIEAERLAGNSLAQIAASKNVSRDALVSTILNAKKEILDAQVAAGKLTQAQADAVYANMQQQVTVMVDRTNVGPAGGRANGQTTTLGLRPVGPALRSGATGGVGGRWNR